MIRFVLRRLLGSIGLLLGTSLLVFLLVTNSFDPLASLRDQPDVPTEVIDARREELHLDEPVLTRYGRWLADAVRGDLGTSFTGRQVSELLWSRVQVTLRMVALATILSLALGVAVGVIGAVRRYSVVDHSMTLLSYIAVSLPVFWLAGLLKEYLAVRLNRLIGHQVIYTVGASDPTLTGGFLDRLANQLGHLALPTIALLLAPIAVWSRYVRMSMLDALSADYVRTALAKGASRSRVVLRHALRNALAPLATLVALDFGHLLAGAIVVEQVFAWQGMGQMLLDGVRAADPNIVLAWLLVTSSAVILFNLVADLLYGWLDPRVGRA
jgi:peptide/nickel transport system permease protein